MQILEEVLERGRIPLWLRDYFWPNALELHHRIMRDPLQAKAEPHSSSLGVPQWDLQLWLSFLWTHFP